jgi:hypothetical protein
MPGVFEAVRRSSQAAPAADRVEPAEAASRVMGEDSRPYGGSFRDALPGISHRALEKAVTLMTGLTQRPGARLWLIAAAVAIVLIVIVLIAMVGGGGGGGGGY